MNYAQRMMESARMMFRHFNALRRASKRHKLPLSTDSYAETCRELLIAYRAYKRVYLR